jgi:hypothetical protein
MERIVNEASLEEIEGGLQLLEVAIPGVEDEDLIAY